MSHMRKCCQANKKKTPTGKTPLWASRMYPLLSECDVDRSFEFCVGRSEEHLGGGGGGRQSGYW